MNGSFYTHFLPTGRNLVCWDLTQGLSCNFYFIHYTTIFIQFSMEPYIVLIFILGYLLIALEHPIKINKTATALVTGTLCWTLFALDVPDSSFLNGDHYSSFVKSLGKQDGLSSIEIYNSFIEAQLAHHLGQI